MISRLRIENYQSHALTDIQLSSTVTVFTGESDQGKTAVLRALRKVVRNTPVGDFFIRWGQKACRVLVEVNGVAVERVVGVRNSGLNTYTVDADAYNNFGTSVPEEVRVALGVADVQTFEKDKIDFNIHTQHEGEFLVGQSGVESLRGRIFARITGSDVVNRAIARVNGELRTLKQEIDRQRVQRTVLQTEIESLAYVEQLGILLGLAEQSLDNGLHLIDEIGILSNAGDALVETQDRLRDTQLELDVRPELDARGVDALAGQATVLRSALMDLRSTYNKLSPLWVVEQAPVVDAQELDTQVSHLTGMQTVLQDLRTTWSKIVRLKRVEDRAPVLDAQELLEIQTGMRVASAVYADLKSVEAQMENTQKLEWATAEQCASAEKAYADLRQELGVCPTCDRPFEENDL